jgi:hypothetical protein
VLGDGNIANATYSLSGTGVLSVSGEETIASRGTGSFIQSGGAHSAISLNIATLAGSQGSLSLMGGYIQIQSDIKIGGTGAPIVQNQGGTGAFCIGGTGQLSVGTDIALYPTSTLNICGGNVSTPTLYLLGTLTQSGGNAVFSHLADSAGSGVATITGGRTTLTLGGSADTLGALNISGAGTLDLQIGGYAQGVNYDLLSLDHSSSLGGTLEIDWVNGFLPQLGDHFMVMTDAAQFVGGFDQFTSNTALFAFSVDYGTNSNVVRVTVIPLPEPGSLGVLIGGEMLLFCRRRRKNLSPRLGLAR